MAHRIPLSPAIFIIGVGMLVLVAFMAIGFQTLRAAHVNPATTLRND
jgi:glycerol uptake facilitator-like aquaporin